MIYGGIWLASTTVNRDVQSKTWGGQITFHLNLPAPMYPKSEDRRVIEYLLPGLRFGGLLITTLIDSLETMEPF